MGRIDGCIVQQATAVYAVLPCQPLDLPISAQRTPDKVCKKNEDTFYSTRTSLRWLKVFQSLRNSLIMLYRGTQRSFFCIITRTWRGPMYVLIYQFYLPLQRAAYRYIGSSRKHHKSQFGWKISAEINEMEDLVATKRGLRDKFLKNWFYWHEF